ncbi:MAG: hypothetical protein ACREA2_21890 [Blastocatellia bacterium]
MKRKKFKRIIRKTHTRFLNDCATRRADDLRREASDLRYRFDLCRHADDERNYTSSEEAQADMESPPVVCEICRKEKLRVQLVTPRPIAEAIEDTAAREAFMKDLLR